MRPIRVVDRDTAARIMRTGKPAGFWLSRMPDAVIENMDGSHAGKQKRILWTGIDADGERAEAMHGCFRNVIEWLSIRQGTFPEDGTIRIRKPLERCEFVGIRVKGDKIERLGKEEIGRAEVYAGFADTFSGKRHKRLRAEVEGGGQEE